MKKKHTTKRKSKVRVPKLVFLRAKELAGKYHSPIRDYHGDFLGR